MGRTCRLSRKRTRSVGGCRAGGRCHCVPQALRKPPFVRLHAAAAPARPARRPWQRFLARLAGALQTVSIAVLRRQPRQSPRASPCCTCRRRWSAASQTSWRRETGARNEFLGTTCKGCRCCRRPGRRRPPPMLLSRRLGAGCALRPPAAACGTPLCSGSAAMCSRSRDTLRACRPSAWPGFSGCKVSRSRQWDQNAPAVADKPAISPRCLQHK